MFARLLETMGDDLAIVNAARRSFGAEVDEIGPKEIHIIRYLARGLPTKEYEAMIDSFEDIWSNEGRNYIKEQLNNYRGTAEHWTPFAHGQMRFHVQMPIFVARQLIRTTVGVVISEMSRRYVSADPDYWFPEEGDWRLAADNVKQGSSNQCLTGKQAAEWHKLVQDHCEQGTLIYRKGVDHYKLAPEIVRIMLSLNTYTDWHWTISLVTAARICRQRLDVHAQKEIQMLAQQINDAASEAFPHSWKALMSYGMEE